MFKALQMAILLVTVFLSLSAAAQSSGPSVKHETLRCDPPSVSKDLMAGQNDLALKRTQVCIDEMKTAVERMKDPPGSSFGDSVNFFGVGHYLCDKAQIQVMMGDLKGADESIKEAEEFAQKWSKWYYHSVSFDWPSELNVTKGFRSERAGDKADARRWYSIKPSNIALGRLAVMAFHGGDTNGARELAQQALSKYQYETAALYVMGTVLEGENKKVEALEEYQKAVNSMMNTERNDFYPIKLAEAEDVRRAIHRLSDSSK